MYYFMIENSNIIGKSQSLSGGEIIDVEVSEEVYNNYQPNRYLYQDGELVINPQYDKDVRIAEIKQALDELDLKSIRALRASDTEYLQQYEEEAIALRNELRTLME